MAQRLARDFGRRAAILGFEQLDLALHHFGRAGRTDGIDIGLVDELERKVSAAEPHRHRGGLDQADQRREIPRRARGGGAQARHFGMALGEVEHPHQRRSAGRNLRIGERAVERKGALRAGRIERHAEGRGAFLGGLHLGPELIELFLRQPPALGGTRGAGELAEIFGHRRQAEQPRQLVRPLDPPVDPHQQRHRRSNIEQGRHTLEAGLERTGALHGAAGAQHHQPSAHRPCGKQQRDQHKRKRRGVHHSTAMRLTAPVQRGSGPPPPTP